MKLCYDKPEIASNRWLGFRRYNTSLVQAPLHYLGVMPTLADKNREGLFDAGLTYLYLQSTRGGHFMSHTKAILQALLVTFIWSLSWVFIKIGLAEIPALVFAGLRYSLAAFTLLIFVAYRSDIGDEIRQLTKTPMGMVKFTGFCILYTDSRCTISRFELLTFCDTQFDA